MQDKAGAAVGVTADHGMNSKADADGAANVIYLEEVCNRTYLHTYTHTHSNCIGSSVA